MGFAGGVVCFFAATMLKRVFGYDDSLDAFGVHGVGGTLGAILTGVFANTLINPDNMKGRFAGLIFGNPAQVGNQLLGVVITYVLAGVGSFVLLKVVDAVVGLRVSESDEYEGLDLSQHGESGYHLEEEFAATVIDEGPVRTEREVAPVAAGAGLSDSLPRRHGGTEANSCRGCRRKCGMICLC